MLNRTLAAFCLLLMVAFCVFWLILSEQRNDMLINEVKSITSERNLAKLRIEEYERLELLMPLLREMLTDIEHLEARALAEALRQKKQKGDK